MSYNPEQPTVWIGISDRSQCPDCANLTGTVKTWQEWMDGDIKPGNGHTVCGDWCRCMLWPAEWAESFGNPPEVNIGVSALTEEILAAGAVVENNTLLKWSVMQEREPGFSPDAQDDIIETARIYLVGNEIEKELLQTDYPQHYKLIKQLLK